MKKYISLLAILLLFVVKASAQVETVGGKVSFGDRVNSAAKKAKDGVVTIGGKIYDTFKGDGSSDLISIKGVKYMPLYSVNLYNGYEATAFRAECQRQFRERYPRAVITSAVCPQTDWVPSIVKNHGQVVGFMETMYCYVIASDCDGMYYLNAKFAYRRFKEIGADSRDVEEAWPEWVRTDVMPRQVYAKLLTK